MPPVSAAASTFCSFEQLLTPLRPVRHFSQLRSGVFMEPLHSRLEQDNKPRSDTDRWCPGTTQKMHSRILFPSDKIAMRTQIK